MESDTAMILSAEMRRLFESLPHSSREEVTTPGILRSPFRAAPLDAVLHSALFAPRLSEVEGFLFIRGCGREPREGMDGLAELIRYARSLGPEDLKQTVDLYNSIDLQCLFRGSRADKDVYNLLGSLVADAWMVRLTAMYPDRGLEVQLTLSDGENTMTKLELLQRMQ